MKNIPKKIYLQVGEEDSDSDDFDKIKLNVFEYRSKEKGK